MSEYSKKKNDELAVLCKERNLPHTGKKADLVKRLEEHDAKNAASNAAAPSKPTANDDEIDWDDEPATGTTNAATTEPTANAIAAGGRGQVSNPQAVPNQEPAIDPAKTDDLSVNHAAGEPATTEEKKLEKDFSSGIADRTVDEEIEKLKARCIKFGMDPNDNEQIKRLERAKKFGTTALAINTALKGEKEGKKRGREGGEVSGADGGLRKRSRGPRGRGRPGPGGHNDREKLKSGTGGDGLPSWMSDKDREAAERRKAKFATA